MSFDNPNVCCKDCGELFTKGTYEEKVQACLEHWISTHQVKKTKGEVKE